VPDPTPEPIQITFSRGTWLALIAFALIMFAGIITQLLLIEDQRSTNDRQLKTIVRQSSRSIPLLDKTRPLVDQTTQGLPAIRRLGRDTQGLLGDLRPLTRDLRDARAPEQLQAAGALARTLLDADVGEMARAVQRADLPNLATDLRAVSSELLRQQRLRRLLVRSNAVLGEVRARHLIEKSSVAAESVPRMETILRESLQIQRETLEIAQQTQRAAERAARSAESIDRKTGPSLAPTSGG
jgi:hypothetical protein